jgi:hypothetical protein
MSPCVIVVRGSLRRQLPGFEYERRPCSSPFVSQRFYAQKDKTGTATLFEKWWGRREHKERPIKDLKTKSLEAAGVERERSAILN